MNLAQNLEASAFLFPDRPAIRERGMEMTYAHLNDRANRVATGLIKMGVKPGDHVGLCALNSADWISFYFGVLKTGAVAVTLPASIASKISSRSKAGNISRQPALRIVAFMMWIWPKT